VAAEAVIRIEGLVKRFGKLTAVDGVSLDVQRGEVFGILGPNGAGKTTTLECVEGLLEPTSGHTFILGVDTHRESEKVKERIGIQLQASAYFDYLTLTEILELFGKFYHRHLPPDALLQRVGLADKAKSTVAHLSGGQRQRFTIAATLVNDPEVVFLDEPTTGLDPQARRSLWEFIQDLHREGRTVVLTTHYMEEAQFLCQRVAIMDMGKIVALDTPARLIHALPVPYVVKLTAAKGLPLEEVQRLEGVKEVSHNNGEYSIRSNDAAVTLTALISWATGNGTRLEHLEVASANLEDVFLALTGKALRE
jgi:ABC-2 type transport system ATP-binding protein